MTRSAVDSVRLTAFRRSAAGGDCVVPLRWSRRASCVAFAASVAWLGWVALRPLPEPAAVSVEDPLRSAAVCFSESSIAHRQSQLGALTSAGNVFAADRAPWAIDAPESVAAQEAASEESSKSAGRDGKATAVSPTNDPAAIDRIGPLEEPPANLRKHLAKLTLVAIYNAGEGAVALVADKSSSGAMHTLRAGDVFGTQQWTVVAIDERRDRLVLRDGPETIFALRMYNADVVRAAGPKSEGDRALLPIPGANGAVAQHASPEQVRKDLIEAGVDPAEIELLLKLAQEADVPPKAATAAAAATSKVPAPAAEKPSGDASEMPPGFADLLRQMTEDAQQSPASDADSRNARKQRRERQREQRRNRRTKSGDE